jgi:hypothetical protein
MVGVVRIDVPIVFLDLGANPFLPAATDDAAFRCISEPSPPARAKAVGRVLRAVCTENLSSGVVVVKSAKDGV